MIPRSEADRDVFTINGLYPEESAYALGAYSRSSKSFKETVKRINRENSSEFLQKFAINFGHASLKDMAHITTAIENVSLLAEMEIVDEPLWDGQARSTRYQDFKTSGYLIPEEVAGGPFMYGYVDAIEKAFSAYNELNEKLITKLKEEHPKPDDMTDRFYENTIKARAFDATRYLLPLATITSVGQVASARSMERQIARLLASPYPEVRSIGEAIREACIGPSWNPRTDGDDHPVGPTLVKHTSPNHYQAKVHERVRQYLQAEGFRVNVVQMPRESGVKLFIEDNVVKSAIAKLIFAATNHTFEDCITMAGLLMGKSKDFLDSVFEMRGAHDELPKEFRGGPLLFEIVTDIGAFRDLNRHRRLTKYRQALTSDMGAETPDLIRELDSADVTLYKNTIADLVTQRLNMNIPSRDYLLPLASRCRSLFVMDIAEAAYIIELRSKPGGHPSYRTTAWQMHKELVNKYPHLDGYIRVCDPNDGCFFDR